MPIQSSAPVTVPAGNTQNVLAISLNIQPSVKPAGIGGSGQLIAQHCMQSPTPDANGNVNPVKIGSPVVTNIPNLFSTDPAPTDTAHQAALTTLETAVEEAVQAGITAGLDPQCAAVYAIMVALQAYVTAKGL